jgi:hypothetical protein
MSAPTSTGGRLRAEADGISSPPETYENAVRIGFPAKLEDKESEVDVNIDFKTTSLSLRRPHRPRLVLAHQPGIADDVGGEDRGEAAKLDVS